MPAPKKTTAKKTAAPKKTASSAKPTTIAAYNKAQTGSGKKICVELEKLLDKGLSDKKGEKKIWHGSPVWFLDGNPIAAYAVRKAGVQLLFWSGRDFNEPDLHNEGTFKASQIHFTDVADIKPTALARWLKKAKQIQWDYKNIVKRRGELVKIGKW